MQRVGPWRLTPGEARALRAVVKYGTNGEAAEHLSIALRTLENQLVRAYDRMRRYGVEMTDGHSRRTLALREWITKGPDK